MVDCGDVSVVLKEYDPRFFPKRRIELDTYSVIISDPALNYGGSLFYEYHKSFTAKAALYIQHFNLKLDRSGVDLELISKHFMGHKANSWSVCGYFSHFASLCPRTAYQASQGSPVK